MKLFIAALLLLAAVVFVAAALVICGFLIGRRPTPKPLDDADPERIWTGDLEP